jgi:hypothetical protein
MNFNCVCTDETSNETLATLRRRLMVKLGFAAQADNPPPGMAELMDAFLVDAQVYLATKLNARHTSHFFRWKMTEGERFYAARSNDEEADLDEEEQCGLRPNMLKPPEGVWVVDTNGVWTPLVNGIVPQLHYSRGDAPGMPERYEIRDCIEVWPAPVADDTYELWIKMPARMRDFADNADKSTLDSDLVYLWALGQAKAHYQQPDWQQGVAQAQAMLNHFNQSAHGTRRYVPQATRRGSMPRPVILNPDSP